MGALLVLIVFGLVAALTKVGAIMGAGALMAVIAYIMPWRTARLLPAVPGEGSGSIVRTLDIVLAVLTLASWR